MSGPDTRALPTESHTESTRMLNFDEARFLRIQSGAVERAAELATTVDKCLGDGAQNLFFLGSGGAGILMQPAAQLLLAQSGFPVFVHWPAELIELGSRHLGPQSIAVIPSLSGTTSESIEALAYCKRAGATVITLTGHEDSLLARDADRNVTNFAEDDTSSESYYLQSLGIAAAVLRARGEIADYDDVLAQLRELPGLLVAVKESAEPAAAQLATTLAADPYHIITGAGSAWPQAYYYGMCILEEMQWIRTRPVHAADFFHGTLELVEPGVSVLLLKGEDGTRPLADRVAGFVARYSGKLAVVDTASYELPGISARVRALVSPVLLATVLERVSAHLEVITGHPLTTRRYYRRVSY
ncbi:MAG: SIS domain-containing protein [Streptosporangiales bacterium]